MFMRSSKLLATASVALVVLIDLATGQGPPIYTNYLQAQQDFRPPPPPMQPVGFLQPGAYPPGAELEREYRKETESEKDDSKDEKKFEKGLKKEEKYDKYDKEGSETTPAPGVLTSFSNSMNDAWKGISSIGRKKRSTNGQDKATTTSGVREPTARSLDSTSVSAAPVTDSYEQLQYKNQGYVYFKVPKYLVCNS